MSAEFAPISASTNDNYTVLITAVPSLMSVMIFGNKSKNLITKFEVTPDTAMAFLEGIVEIFDGKCQAILLHIYNFKPVGFAHVTSFAYEIRCKLADNRIYNYFYSGQSLFTSGLLISAKIKSAKNDTFLCVRVKGEDRLAIMEFLFTDTGYSQVREDLIEKADEESALDLRERLLKGTKPKHIIVYGDNTEMAIMKKLKKNVFSNEKIHRLDKSILKESIAQTLKIAKYVRDRTIIKYHVIPKCAKDYAVYFESRDEPFFTAKAGEALPIWHEQYAFRDPVNMNVCGFDDVTMEKRLIYTYDSNSLDNQKRHRSKLVFFVDGESFPIVRNYPVIVDIIQELPGKLDDVLEKKIPVIVFIDNLSFICAVKKDEEEYSFLEGWNGEYGHDAAMYVNGLHHFFGLEAKNMKKEHPTHCLTNLNELMASPQLSEFQDPAFEAAGDPDNEEPVGFYMTKFLEEHFKVIRDETGQQVEEIAIWLVFKEYEYFKDRLLDCFKEFEIHFHFLQLDLPE